MRVIPNMRWWIAVLLATATGLNYLDRQSFPVVVNEIRKFIAISDSQYGDLTSLFLLAYGIMYAGGGWLMDRLGTRAGYALVIVWWSAANALTGVVSSVFGLGVCRFLLGMGEGGGFPGSAKAVAEWFPPAERSMAFGIFNTGSSVGAVIAPPLIAAISTNLGWRWVFFITGALGFVWAWAWLKLYQPPQQSKLISPAERTLIESSIPPAVEQTPISWRQMLASRQVLGLMLAKFLSDAAWYFFIFWLPKYLGDVRELDIKKIGYFAWIPYAFAGAGSFLGGWLGTTLIRRGMSIDHARKIALGLAACLMPVSLLIAASPLAFALVFFSLAMFGHQFWSATLQTLPADLFPSRVVGSAGGLLGCAGSFGGMLFGYVVGRLIASHGYAPAFLIAGLMHPVAFVLILTIVKKIERVHSSLGEA